MQWRPGAPRNLRTRIHMYVCMYACVCLQMCASKLASVAEQFDSYEIAMSVRKCMQMVINLTVFGNSMCVRLQVCLRISKGMQQTHHATLI